MESQLGFPCCDHSWKQFLDISHLMFVTMEACSIQCKNLALLSGNIMVVIDVSAVLSAELTPVGESSTESETGSQQMLFRH